VAVKEVWAMALVAEVSEGALGKAWAMALVVQVSEGALGKAWAMVLRAGAGEHSYRVVPQCRVPQCLSTLHRVLAHLRFHCIQI